RHATVMASVHALPPVERFLATNLADDDAVRTHTERVDDELPLTNGALALDVGWPCLEPDHVTLSPRHLGGVLDRHDTLVASDKAGQHIQQRCLAGASATGHDGVEACADRPLQEGEHGCGEGRALDEIVGAKAIRAKAADRHA